MRLIDADELMALLRLRKNSGIGTEIEEIPTVKAIPIEWILDWLLKYEAAYKTREDVTKMLNDWRKENEAD